MATFSFNKVDRFYRKDFGAWPSTLKRWSQEGLPGNWKETNFFHYDKEVFNVADLGWCDSPFSPPFEELILREDSGTRMKRDKNGIVFMERKGDPDTSMPLWLEHPVRNREDWKRIKWRLQPDSKERLANLEKVAGEIGVKGDQDFPVIQGTAGGFLHMRNLFGLKGSCIAMYRDQDLVHEVMENWLSINKFVVANILDLIDLDAVWIAEDICYRHGLLISPKAYREFLSPYYEELADFLRSFGVKVVYDSDGNIKQLIPLLIEWGCDGLEPFEVQADNDVREVRKKYGEELIIAGGIDKRPLAGSFQDIEREVERVLPFFSDKRGYIPMVDHTIPPNVPLKNYLHFLKVLREYDS